MPQPLAIIAALVATACTCGAESAPEPRPQREVSFEVAPLDETPRVEGDPMAIRAIDEARAIAIERASDGMRVAMVQRSSVLWSRLLPCDRARAGIVDASAAEDLVVVRCPVGAEPGVIGTVALETSDGALRWSTESGSAAELRGGGLTLLRAAGAVIGVGGPSGLEARDPIDGTLRWARRGDFFEVAVVGDMLLAQSLGDDALLDAQTGHAVRALPGRVVGVVDGGVCVLEREQLEWVGRGETRTLATAPVLAELIEAGMRPDEWGLRIECGRRGAHTVLLADADTHNLVAVIEGPEGPVRTVRLPRTVGPPVVRGWERELPRHVVLATWPRRVVVVDLDEARIAWTLDVPFMREAEGFAEMLQVVARSGDRFLLSNDRHIIAIDGADAAIRAEERSLVETGWWFDVERAVAGDAVWSARVEGDDARIEPARFAPDGPIALDWTARRAPPP